MSVNIRVKYLGDSNLSKRNRPYRVQLDYYLNGKRKRETIKDVTFNPNEKKEVRNEKNRIVENIRAKF